MNNEREIQQVTKRVKCYLSELNSELLHLGQMLADDDDDEGCGGIIFCAEQVGSVIKIFRGHYKDALYKLREKGEKVSCKNTKSQ